MSGAPVRSSGSSRYSPRPRQDFPGTSSHPWAAPFSSVGRFFFGRSPMRDDRKRKPFVVARRWGRRTPPTARSATDRPPPAPLYDRQATTQSGATLADVWPDPPKPAPDQTE
jgi:hypothetical protein